MSDTQVASVGATRPPQPANPTPPSHIGTYSHYWGYDPIDPSFLAAWPQMVADARVIADYVRSELAITLADGLGGGEPQIDERAICLNGSRREGLHYQTFAIWPEPWKVWAESAREGHRGWAKSERLHYRQRGLVEWFCKTARQPYDIAVAAILLRCQHLAPDAFAIDSDGSWEVDWQPALEPPTPGAVGVVNTLFAQAETPHTTRLASFHQDGLACTAAAL